MKSIEWAEDKVLLIDQTRLPFQKVIIECRTHGDVARAIKEMRIRGAPAIGVAAAMGIALGAQGIESSSWDEFHKEFIKIAQVLTATRPTAVNLFWAIERMKRCIEENRNKESALLKELLIKEALKIAEEDIEINRRIGRYGSKLVKDGATLLTHCNAGALATAGYGTALGVIRRAWEEGKRIRVFVDETRPYLQGARLTTWELKEEGIPCILITDNMAGYFMQKGKIDLVIVGADRIAANGDVANKIGTYSLAVLAKEHSLPFYVAAPSSTFDLSLSCGAEIPIEERGAEEVTHCGGVRIAPEEVRVANPAFDITPARYISAFITEKGIIEPPYEERLAKVIEGQ